MERKLFQLLLFVLFSEPNKARKGLANNTNSREQQFRVTESRQNQTFSKSARKRDLERVSEIELIFQIRLPITNREEVVSDKSKPLNDARKEIFESSVPKKYEASEALYWKVHERNKSPEEVFGGEFQNSSVNTEQVPKNKNPKTGFRQAVFF